MKNIYNCITIVFVAISINFGLADSVSANNIDTQVISEYKKILMRQNSKIRSQLWVSPQGENTIPIGAKAVCAKAQTSGSWKTFYKNTTEEINSLNYSNEIKQRSLKFIETLATLGKKFYCPNIPIQSTKPSKKRSYSRTSLLPRTNNIQAQSTQSSKRNMRNRKYIKLAYCSSSSGQGDWISWGKKTPYKACQLVRNKFASWGQTINRSEFGYYKSNGENKIQVSCSGGFQFTKIAFSYEVFNKAIEVVRQNGVEGTCIYKVID